MHLADSGCELHHDRSGDAAEMVFEGGIRHRRTVYVNA